MPRTPQIPLIDAGRCTGCGRCIAACHLPLIAFETRAWRKFAVLQDADHCTGCRQCAWRCPVGAITMLEISQAAAVPPINRDTLQAEHARA